MSCSQYALLVYSPLALLQTSHGNLYQFSGGILSSQCDDKPLLLNIPIPSHRRLHKEVSFRSMSWYTSSVLTMDSNLDYEICIVDGSSPGNTAEVARQLQHVFPARIILKERSGKLGLGRAYVHLNTFCIVNMLTSPLLCSPVYHWKFHNYHGRRLQPPPEFHSWIDPHAGDQRLWHRHRYAVCWRWRRPRSDLTRKFVSKGANMSSPRDNFSPLYWHFLQIYRHSSSARCVRSYGQLSLYKKSVLRYHEGSVYRLLFSGSWWYWRSWWGTPQRRSRLPLLIESSGDEITHMLLEFWAYPWESQALSDVVRATLFWMEQFIYLMFNWP